MAQLTDDQVRHIAKLARLNLSDEEVNKFTTELTSIIDYIELLQEVDTKGVSEAPQVTGMENSFREDVVRSDGPEPESLLKTSALPLSDHQIQTPSAHG